MEVTPQSGGPLGPSPGRVIANPQARFVTPQKSLGKRTGKISGKELTYPSKFLSKGKATSKLKGSLARKAKQLLKKGKR